VYIVGPANNGVLYQYREVTFGDHPTIEALVEVRDPRRGHFEKGF
jgi:hypothetical protein